MRVYLHIGNGLGRQSIQFSSHFGVPHLANPQRRKITDDHECFVLLGEGGDVVDGVSEGEMEGDVLETKTGLDLLQSLDHEVVSRRGSRENERLELLMVSVGI